MTRHVRTLRWAMCTLICMLFVADCYAQFGGRGGMGGGSRGGRDQIQSNGQTPRQPQPAYDAYEQIEYRLALLEEDLRLQPGQSTLWDDFARKVRAYANDVERVKGRGAVVTAGAGAGLQHIERAANIARNQVTALEDIAIAAKPLYASFAPNQATLADMRIPTIVAPQPRGAAAPDVGYNLPDLGSSRTPPR